jgi:LPS-assembly protein
VPRKAWISALLLLLIAKLSSSLSAALPELSSIDPLEFDEKAQRLVALGDARLDFGDARIGADRINYYQEFSLADALDNVSISKGGFRLVADRLTFDAKNSTFAINALRTGQWPIYLSAVAAGGTSKESTIEGATLYYGAPNPFSLSLNSDLMEYSEQGNGSLKMGATTVRIGAIPLLYLPSYTYHLNGAPYHVDIDGGHDSRFGTYLQSTTLFPVNSWLRAGANLDLYSKRGVLAGPAAQYSYNSENQSIEGAVHTGYISDQGERRFDIFNDPIDQQRGFAEWRHQQHIGERVNITAAVSYWSDSEVTRDFRKKYYKNNQHPDSFFEGVYMGDNYYLSTFARFRPNDFQLIQERLPEVRYELLPVPFFDTGAYHRLSASYAHMREDFDRLIPAISAESHSDRFDLSYRIERPLNLTDWLCLTPLVGARLTHYENQEIDPTTWSTFATTPAAQMDDQFTRGIYEFGFDLEARAYANYATQNRIWRIDGLRHLVRPVLRYRYFSDSDSLNEIAQIERSAFNLSRPSLNLGDLRNTDSIQETHLARLGVENLFQTRAQHYGSRTLATLNFYQDILLERGTRYDGEPQDTFHASWVEMVLSPAPWLRFDIASRFRTESMTMEEVRTRTTIKSGEIWELGLSSNLLNDRIDQYRLDFIYRLNERYSWFTELRYDAETSQFTETEIGLHTRIGNTWEVVYALTFRQDASRESDIEFNVRLNLSEY